MSIKLLSMDAEMDFSSINWLVVVACVLASMIIGSIWFSPKIFYPAWLKALGQIDKNDPNDQNIWTYHSRIPGPGYIHGLDGEHHEEHVWRRHTWLRRAGFILWLGFVAPSSLTNKLFADHVKARYV